MLTTRTTRIKRGKRGRAARPAAQLVLLRGASALQNAGAALERALTRRERRERQARLWRYAAATGALMLGTVAARRAQRATRTRGTLRDKVVVVTGASSGIGRAVALECVARGAKIVLAARNDAELQRVAREARELGGDVLVVPTDVRDRAQVLHLVDRAVQQYGKIDVMLNNAAVWFIDSVEHSSETNVRNVIETNVMGVLHGVQAALPVMRRQGFGHVINMASAASRVGFPYVGAYAGSKAFIEVMTQSLRQELRHVEKTPIHVSSVLPVTVRTPFFDRAPNAVSHGRGAHMMHPILEADTVARAVVACIERPRPVVYPFKPAKTFGLLNDLLPGVADRAMSLMRPDRHTGLLNKAEPGSHRAERPITPTVRGGELRT